MAHKKPTEIHVKINGAGAIVIWRTGYKEFFPGKEVIYRNAAEPGGKVIWRLGRVRGKDKSGVLHLKALGSIIIGINGERIGVIDGKWIKSSERNESNNRMQELSARTEELQMSEPNGDLFTAKAHA